jgi:FKBP-type peptidyl-prolyl cis-trans isomerase FklB
MKTQTIVFCISIMMTSVLAAAQTELQTDKDKINYSLGFSIGKGLLAQGIEIDADRIAQGIKDVLSGGQTLLTEQEMQQLLSDLQKKVVAKEEAKKAAMAETNKKEGETFLSENKQKEGVITLPSGLQYKIIKTGTGAKPKETDTVVTNYRGTFIDGTEFDSSEKSGPATFQVDRVIEGWTEALQLMEVGAKWQLFVPHSLAYGEKGAGNVIGPNQTLIVDVELLEIKAAEPDQQ